MPIDYSKYPPNWKKEIRPRILERDGHKCKWCGVENGAIGYREDNGDFVRQPDGAMWLVGLRLAVNHRMIIKIVLTITHIHDHDPMSCSDDNLAALCQRCHNIHDKTFRKENAKKTRESRKSIGLF